MDLDKGQARKPVKKRKRYPSEEKPFKMESMFCMSLGDDPEPISKKPKTWSSIFTDVPAKPQKRDSQKKRSDKERPPLKKKPSTSTHKKQQQEKPKQEKEERRPFLDPPTKPPIKLTDAPHPSWKAKREQRIKLAMTVAKGVSKSLEEPDNRKTRRRKMREGDTSDEFDVQKLTWSLEVN